MKKIITQVLRCACFVFMWQSCAMYPGYELFSPRSQYEAGWKLLSQQRVPYPGEDGENAVLNAYRSEADSEALVGPAPLGFGSDSEEEGLPERRCERGLDGTIIAINDSRSSSREAISPIQMEGSGPSPTAATYEPYGEPSRNKRRIIDEVNWLREEVSFLRGALFGKIRSSSGGLISPVPMGSHADFSAAASSSSSSIIDDEEGRIRRIPRAAASSPRPQIDQMARPASQVGVVRSPAAAPRRLSAPVDKRGRSGSRKRSSVPDPKQRTLNAFWRLPDAVPAVEPQPAVAEIVAARMPLASISVLNVENYRHLCNVASEAGSTVEELKFLEVVNREGQPLESFGSTWVDKINKFKNVKILTINPGFKTFGGLFISCPIETIVVKNCTEERIVLQKIKELFGVCPIGHSSVSFRHEGTDLIATVQK